MRDQNHLYEKAGALTLLYLSTARADARNPSGALPGDRPWTATHEARGSPVPDRGFRIYPSAITTETSCDREGFNGR